MIRSGLYNALGAVIRLSLSLLVIPLLTRLIGLDEFGLWSFGAAIIGVAGLSEIGLSLSTTVFVARDLASEDHQDVVHTLTITLSTMLVLASAAAISLWLASVPLSGLVPGISAEQRSELAQTLAIGSVVIWARLLQQILIGLKQAYQRFGLINLLQTSQTAALTMGWLMIAWGGGSITNLMGWQAIITLSFLGLHIGFSLRLLPKPVLRPVWDHAKAISILRYSLATWVGLLGAALFTQVDRLIVGATLGPSMLGFYAAITSVTMQINTISAMLVQPQFPIITQLFAAQPLDRQRMVDLVRATLAMNTAGALIFGAALLTLSAVALAFLVPDPTPLQLTAFQCLIVIYSLYALNAVGTYVLFGADRVRLSSGLVLCCGLMALVLITLGAQTFGIMGAVLGNAGYVATLAVYFFAMRQLDLPPWGWLAWVRIPLALFLVGALLILFGAGRSDLVPLLGAALTCAIAGWFALTQRETMLQFLRRVFLARS